ncbi:MAG: TetR family transcriptional regulator [Methylophaga sp.]|nr:MAG: TetR family transcriptional regulator [Methylophaga sp.]
MNDLPTKKQQTYQRILDAASQSFRSHGYAGIGVDGIAKKAGVTSGAFYAHLGSKDKAFNAALEIGLGEVIAAVPKFQQDAGSNWVEVFVNYYLGQPHIEDLACGCAMTTLSPEVVRTDPEIHALYEAKMKQIVALIAEGLEGNSTDECTARAWSLIGILIGGLTMIRAVKTRKTAKQITSSILVAAINIAGKTK